MPEASKKNKKVLSAIFRIVLIVIAGMIVGYGVFSWNASSLVGNQLPMPFGIGASVVMSSSMEPNLHVNDLVFVQEKDDYQVDDIIVFQEGNLMVIHRVIMIDDGAGTVTTKGDANNAPDDPIETDRIKGKMVFRIPFIGIIVKYIKTVPGTLLILFLAIFLLYRSRQKERTADMEQMDSIVEEIRRLQELQNGSQDGAEQTSASPEQNDSAQESGSASEDSPVKPDDDKENVS